MTSRRRTAHLQRRDRRQARRRAGPERAGERVGRGRAAAGHASAASALARHSSVAAVAHLDHQIRAEHRHPAPQVARLAELGRVVVALLGRKRDRRCRAPGRGGRWRDSQRSGSTHGTAANCQRRRLLKRGAVGDARTSAGRARRVRTRRDPVEPAPPARPAARLATAGRPARARGCGGRSPSGRWPRRHSARRSGRKRPQRRSDHRSTDCAAGARAPSPAAARRAIAQIRRRWRASALRRHAGQRPHVHLQVVGAAVGTAGRRRWSRCRRAAGRPRTARPTRSASGSRGRSA